MAASTTEKENLITGNVVRVTLPSDGRKYKRIVMKINSKYTQIGDGHKIIGLNIPRSQTDSDEMNFRCLDFENGSEPSSPIFIEAIAVQVNVGNEQVEIDVKSDDASFLQIGDRCKICIEDASVGPRKFLELPRDVMTGSVTRRPKRKKPAKHSTPNKKQPTKTVPINSPECLELYQMFFEKVQKIIHPLRDNGKWDLFDDKLNTFIKEYEGNDIWKALLKLEQGIRISYHSKFDSESYLEEAEKKLREGWEIIKALKGIDPSIKRFFEGRFQCYLTSVYRRMKLYGRAQDSIARAEKIFRVNADTSSSLFLYDRATVLYEKGSRYHEFDKNGAFNKEAKECFQKCYGICQQIKKETGYDFIEKGQLAQLKKVIVLLGCSTKEGRKRRISDEDLEEAKKCINEIDVENKTRNSIPNVEQLQLLLAKADIYFRMKDYRQSEMMAQQDVALAEEHGFDPEPARKRIQDIRQRYDVEDQRSTRGKQGNVETVDHRVSCDADGSGTQSTGSD